MAMVPISEFRKHLHSFMKLVAGGEELQLVRHGRVVAVVAPPRDPPREARQRLRGLRESAVVGDVESPIDVPWDAD